MDQFLLKDVYKRQREGFEILTGVRFSDFLELDRPSMFSPDPAVHGNASKFLLYNDPLLGTYDSLVPEDVEAFYAQAARELARVESIAGEYAGLFRTQKTLSMLLEKKAALGRNIKRAYDLSLIHIWQKRILRAPIRC